MSVVLKWKPNKWEKAPLMCRIFGHKWVSGWYGDRPYFNQSFRAVDGIQRFHIGLTCECDRCGNKTEVGRIHHRSKSSIIGRDYPE